MPEIFATVNGHRLFGLLAGQGGCTVILDSGLGGTTEDWAGIQPEVARFAKVLCYDRAGLGRSEKASVPRMCAEIVSDLRGLLAAANLPPPYIIVAHSWSGLHARWFANRYPAEIAGMLLVDAVHEDKYNHFARVLPEERARRMWAVVSDPSQNDEGIDRMASIEQVRSTQRVYDFPLLVLTRAAGADPLDRIEVELQAEFLKFSRRSRQYFSKHGDHHIQAAEPGLVINAILQILEDIP